LSPQVLSGRLRELEQRGYVSHEDLSVMPLHRVYHLRPPGQRLIEDLGSIVRSARAACGDGAAGRASTAMGR
jgi:DNA-binding HxlR family transcriptional regulator